MNFSAGPAALPLSALQQARDELLDFDGSGMSVMEQSHRGKTYEKVHHEAESLLRELLGLGDSYAVAFVQGGASQQFGTIPLNFLPPGGSADYVSMGTWSEKAIVEAEIVGKMVGAKARVAGASKGEKVPTDLVLDPNAAYLHITSNETIHGVEYAIDPAVAFPKSSAPLVCDMSSDFLGRVIDVNAFDFIYAGAQKNIGPSGVTVIIAKKEFIAKGRSDLPTMLQFRTHTENDSLYNTPPTFGIYLMRNVLQWLKGEGGVEAIEVRNRAKANTLYQAIDASNGFYFCPVERSSRSIMNVVFRLKTPALEDAFVKAAEANKMVGLKGHRSVGGIRASLYNAVELEWAEKLGAFMNDFAKKNATSS